MNKYSYVGPVLEFDVCISHKWYGTTVASSEKKAKSNLSYQFKKQTNRTDSSKISLPGRLEMEV